MASHETIGTSEMFDSYEEDFRRHQRSLREKLVVLADHSKDIKSRRAASLEATTLLEQADQALKMMESEANSMTILRASLAPKLKELRSEIAARKRELTSGQSSLQSAELSSNATGNALQDTNSRLRNSAQRLNDAKKQALEAEDVGMDVMGDLREQRDIIQRSKGHMKESDSNLGTSKRIMEGMNRHVLGNKILMVCIIIVLFLILILVIFIKIQKHFGHSNEASGWKGWL